MFMTAAEAERAVTALVSLTVDEVGSDCWNRQQEAVQSLNLQAHASAQAHADEFVKEAVLSHGKLDTLLLNLLAFEVWQEKVFPHLAGHLAQSSDGALATYLLLHNSATTANLLEVLLYHQDMCEALGEDAALEMCDWCYRRLLHLSTDGRKHAEKSELGAREMMNATPEQELAGKVAEIDFATAISACTILRYITDCMATLPLGVLPRLVRSSDTIMALAGIIERPPWERRRGGTIQKFAGGSWRAVAGAERMQLCQPEAQAWLALSNLLLEPRCHAAYDLGSFRRDALLRLSPRLTELLMDQLPPLRALRGALDRLSLDEPAPALGSQEPKEESKPRLILEQVPVFRSQLLHRDDWEALAARQRETVFAAGALRPGQAQLDRMVAAFDALGEMQPESDAAQGKGIKASFGTLGFTSQRMAAVGLHEDWARFKFELDLDQNPQSVTVRGPDKRLVSGSRYRLKAVDENNSRPIASNGRVAATHNGCTAEALINLPSASTRDSSELPETVWATIGSLSADSFALQLKLKRSMRALERDPDTGEWFAYHPSGGAVTVLVAVEEPAAEAKWKV